MNRTLNPIQTCAIKTRVLCFVVLSEDCRLYYSSVCISVPSPQGEVAVWDRMNKLSYTFVTTVVGSCSERGLATFHEVLWGN